MTAGRKTFPSPASPGKSDTASAPDGPFEYADYELSLRDRQWNRELLAGHVGHFAGCRKVLDVACGSGIFLELLAEHGIPAIGVERNARVAEWTRAHGWDVVCEDAFDFLGRSSERYDGVFCSHFIEHLPFERVLTLVEAMAARLEAGGTLVLVFPNPESIRMQLFGFWRDPEHVRFYHPELIEAVCRHYGLDVVHTNRADEPFAIAPLSPPAAASRGEAASGAGTEPGSGDRPLRNLGRRWYLRLLRALRLVPRGEVASLEARVGREREALRDELVSWAERATWAINRMWAWPDNALIVCRKRDRSAG